MKKKKILSVLIVIIWMIFIFYMSSCDGNISTGQSNIIVDIIINLFNIDNIEIVSFVIRKLAHFSEYFILGLLLCNMFRYLNRNIIYSIVISIIYAISDEIHQLFVPGRYCSIFDIFVDSLGSISGIIIYFIIFKIIFLRK